MPKWSDQPPAPSGPEVPLVHGDGPAGDALVSLRDVGKRFPVFESPGQRLLFAMRDLASRLGVGGPPAQPPGFQALAGISLEVRPGEVLGVIGENGSGKTTLLQIVAGILNPTQGRVFTRGKVAALLELGSGFDPEFTGRENVRINGAILGLSGREILGHMDEILEFADIGAFADRPVKTYSAGMSVRLAFAVQACLAPDVLLVDEVLSVGDVFFQLKCHRRIEKLVSRGAALILVSHNMAQVEKYCGRVLVLDRGRCDFLGDPNVAVHRYLSRQGAAGRGGASGPRTAPGEIRAGEEGPETLLPSPERPGEESFLDLSRATVLGDQEAARCLGVALSDPEGRAKRLFEMGETARFFLEFEALSDLDMPVLAVALVNRHNLTLHFMSSLQCGGSSPARLAAGSRVSFDYSARLDLAPDHYLLMAALGSIPRDRFLADSRLNTANLHPDMKQVLKVMNLGPFQVTERKGEKNYPFLGLCGLAGSGRLRVLNPSGFLDGSGSRE